MDDTPAYVSALHIGPWKSIQTSNVTAKSQWNHVLSQLRPAKTFADSAKQNELTHDRPI
ncbi:hypothetical protein ACU8KH_00057 [Lachancea thermotolerans]